MYKASLRYSESLSLSILGIKIPKSTLNYWEINYEFLIKFTDWNKNLHEVFLCVRVGETLIPVSADLITSDYGLAFADGAFDAKLVLNDLVSKGYIPLVKPKVKPGGYGARIRDRIFDKKLYRFSFGEGLFEL